MRNRALHDALRDFALEAAALLTDEQRAGAELEFDVDEEAARRGPVLYRYRPLTERFIRERWDLLRELPCCPPAAETLGSGATTYLRVRGLRGEQAEPALLAMLERLYEDATSFVFPEERFERVYEEVERTLYQGTVHATVLASLPGLFIDAPRVDLGDGLALARGDTVDAPPEAAWPEGAEEPATLCLLECDVELADPIPVAEAHARFKELVDGLRLFKAGAVSLGELGYRQSGDGRWTPLALGGTGAARGEAWVLEAGEEGELVQFMRAIRNAPSHGPIAWALSRFHMGCSRERSFEAFSDYLLALRALLDATSDTGRASMGLRLAALCAEEGERHGVQRRVELAFALERVLMGGGREKQIAGAIGAESPLDLVDEIEGHLRALLRDVLCGYLDEELKAVADDILLESSEPIEIEARDLRLEPESPLDQPTEEFDVLAAEPVRASVAAEWRPADSEPAPEPEPSPTSAPIGAPEGVTPSADWLDDDPESYSAPV
jgi:hypothetical protein